MFTIVGQHVRQQGGNGGVGRAAYFGPGGAAYFGPGGAAYFGPGQGPHASDQGAGSTADAAAANSGVYHWRFSVLYMKQQP